MKLISHRGNVSGINKNLENTEDYIIDAIKLGYDVEVDVWFLDDKWYFGHDYPEFQFDMDWYFRNCSNKTWFHCKNLDALLKLKDLGTPQYFWHQKDDFTLTSTNHIWTYPGKMLTPNSICVLPEQVNCYSFVVIILKCIISKCIKLNYKKIK